VEDGYLLASTLCGHTNTNILLSIPSNGYSQITFRPWDLPIIDGHSRLRVHLYLDQACLPYPRHNISRTRNVGAKVTTHATPKANSRFSHIGLHVFGRGERLVVCCQRRTSKRQSIMAILLCLLLVLRGV
jgi:hypothetical protein